jgi:hypothetical protein
LAEIEESGTYQERRANQQKPGSSCEY